MIRKFIKNILEEMVHDIVVVEIMSERFRLTQMVETKTNQQLNTMKHDIIRTVNEKLFGFEAKQAAARDRDPARPRKNKQPKI